jgi:hypothetical protein
MEDLLFASKQSRYIFVDLRGKNYREEEALWKGGRGDTRRVVTDTML